MVWNKADVCMLEVKVLGIEGYVPNLNWVVRERTVADKSIQVFGTCGLFVE